MSNPVYILTGSVGVAFLSLLLVKLASRLVFSKTKTKVDDKVAKHTGHAAFVTILALGINIAFEFRHLDSLTYSIIALVWAWELSKISSELLSTLSGKTGAVSFLTSMALGN